MVAAAETISEPKLHGKRCGASIPSAPSAVNLTDQRPRITDQKCGSSDDLFITHYSWVIERCASQGMTLDSVTGSYYARNRNYSPSLGRWTNQDPAGYINGANTYQFVGSDPAGNVDPWGLAGGATATGQVIPATTPGSPPGSGSVTVTGTTGPVATGIPGTTVTVGATGTASTGGGYTGSVTATGTVKTGGGSSVSIGIRGAGSGKITKQPKSPTGGVQIKCQYKSAPVLGATLSPFATYRPPWIGSPEHWQMGVNINLGNGLSVTPSYSSQTGATLFIGIGGSW